MNTIVKFGAAGALTLAAAVANATVAQPETGSSDVILFAEVLNSSGSVIASYAGDTGVSVSSAFAGVNATFTGDANLAALFAADNVAAGDSLVWAVQGGQYTGGASSTGFITPNVAQFVTTAGNPANISNKNSGNLAHWGSTLTNAVATLNGNLTANGNGSSVEGPAAASAGVWDLNTPSGISGWNNNGPGTSMTELGTAETLYSVTGPGGSVVTKLALVTNGTVTLTSAGLQFSTGGGTSPVPLPAAVWLLGSGLLGLAGVGRRKTVKA